MPVELIKDFIKVDSIIGETTAQAIIEGDILIPDVKPDISRIIEVKGDVRIKKRETQENNIAAEGEIRFKILYASNKGDEPIYSIDSSTEFKQNIQLEGLSSAMANYVEAAIEHIDYTINNERKIGIKAVVNLTGKGVDRKEIKIIKGIEGLEDIEILKEKVQYSDVVGINLSEALVKDAFELDEGLSPIKEIVKWETSVLEKEAKITDGKVIAAGTVIIELIYIADDEEYLLKTMKKEIPFTHFIEVQQAFSDMQCKLKMKVEEFYIEVKENIQGEKKILEIEAIVKAEAKVTDNQSIEIVIDAYSPSKALKASKSRMELSRNTGTNRSQTRIKEILDIPSGKPPVTHVLSVYGSPILTDYNLMENKVVFEGILETAAIYVSDEPLQPVYSYMQEIPFKHYVEVEGMKPDMEASVDLTVEEIYYNIMNGSQIEVKASINAVCEVYSKKAIDAVIDIEELEEAADSSKRPSLTVYYFRQGDSLWKLAKKYHTTVRQIMLSNDIENPEELKPGDHIIIEKVYNFKI